MKYDYLIIGSGLFGATFAHFAHKQGKKCLVIDKPTTRREPILRRKRRNKCS